MAGLLRCPHCHEPLARDGRVWGCAGGHRFDVARQGHVTLLAAPTRHAGDTAAMLDARAAVQGAGHLDAVTDAVVDLLGDLPDGAVVEVGAGTGHHLRRVLDVLGPRPAVAMDVSTHAVRRAARSAPPDTVVVRADAWRPWPVDDAVVAGVLTVFGPRNPREVERVLVPGGCWVVAVPAADHLAELRAPLGMLDIEAAKGERLADDLAPTFAVAAHRAVRETRRVDRATAVAFAAMGPTAHHRTGAELDQAGAALDDEVDVTVAVDVHRFERR